MMIERLKYNNLTMALYIIICVIEEKKHIDLLRLSVLAALLQDDGVVDVMNNREEDPTFANLRVVSRYMTVNFNRRFYNVLPLVVNSMSILLDAGCVSIENGEVFGNDKLETFSSGNDDIEKGEAARKIRQAVPSILRVTDDVSTKKMVQQLNILI